MSLKSGRTIQHDLPSSGRSVHRGVAKRDGMKAVWISHAKGSSDTLYWLRVISSDQIWDAVWRVHWHRFCLSSRSARCVSWLLIGVPIGRVYTYPVLNYHRVLGALDFPPRLKAELLGVLTAGRAAASQNVSLCSWRTSLARGIFLSSTE